jgi:hypothetical protein
MFIDCFATEMRAGFNNVQITDFIDATSSLNHALIFAGQRLNKIMLTGRNPSDRSFDRQKSLKSANDITANLYSAVKSKLDKSENPGSSSESKLNRL